MNDAQPFHIYGTSRIRDETASPCDLLEVIVNGGTGELAEESPVHTGARPERTATRGTVAELVSGG